MLSTHSTLHTTVSTCGAPTVSEVPRVKHLAIELSVVDTELRYNESTVCISARFLQLLVAPAMMTDAHENHRNRAGAGGHQRAAAAYARGRNHVAAYISGATASQLSAVFLGPAHLAHRHVDAADCDELVRLPNHELKTSARRGIGGRICANDAFIHLGRRAG